MCERERALITMTYQLYKDLDLTKTASEDMIKKQFKTLARIHHPDKGGNAERFKTIGHAYEILSDPVKKKQYDMCGGVETPQGGGGGGGGGFGFPFMPGFSNFGEHASGFMFGGDRRSRTTQVKPTIYHIQVSLSEIYSGVKKTISVSHAVRCGSCTGTGTLGNVGNMVCKTCCGKGEETFHRMLGPGMIQQSTRTCSTCRGSGRNLSEANRCRACSGQGTTNTKTSIVIDVLPGADSSTILYSDKEKGGFVRDAVSHKLLARPLVVMLKCQKHDVFQRYAEHLLTTMKINVWEALGGFDRTLSMLDGTVCRVVSEPGKVCSPGTYIVCKNKGLPLMKTPKEYGTLYVKLDIVFPQVLNNKQQQFVTSNIQQSTSTNSQKVCVGNVCDERTVIKILEATKERTNSSDKTQSSTNQTGQDCRAQ